jgi:hypothetical protein
VTDRRIAKWTEWIEGPIESDVVTMLLHRATWKRLGEIIVAHGSLPDSYFWEYLRDTYGPTQAVAVRRQADTYRDSANLGKLLSEIAADSELITRAFWIGLWNVRNDPINSAIVARQWHHAFGGDVGEHLDPAIPAGDCDRLAAAAAAVKRYVDENVAHSDMSPAKVEATFNDIHGAIDTISGLFTTYAALLTAKGWAGLTPVIQGDWEVIFREPWIRED